MGHFKEVCRHNVVLRQCRCMSPDKVVRIVECDHDDEHEAKMATIAQALGAEERIEVGSPAAGLALHHERQAILRGDIIPDCDDPERDGTI